MPKDVKEKVSKASKPTSTKDKKPAKAPKDKNAPKKALSSYMIFSQEQRAKVKEDNPSATFGELGKLLGAKWKGLSDGEKQPYVDLADKDKIRASEAAAAYEAGGGGAAKPSSKAKPASKKKEVAKEESEEDDASDDE
ncbi:high mobility group box domain-containing protein [Mrakia frigida]|uniref:high mobility group box domain-containing protein n=1 Tax=Mrakia frigida TaxID=29902 RepID=UPI003FCBF60B